MSLKFVDPSALPTQNILLYGPPKVGKTVGALSAPGPILLLNAEGGDAALKGRALHPDTEVREVVYENRNTLNEVYQYLKAGGDGTKTLVADSVGEIYAKLLEEIGGARPSQQNYGDVNTILERFIRSLKNLPFHVVLIAHEQIDDATDDRIVRPATGGKKLPQTVMAMMSIVGYCGVVPATDSEPTRYVAQLIEGRGRRAGSRWQEELGPSREVDISDWLTVIAGTMAAQAKPAEEKPKPRRRSRTKATATEANGNGVAKAEGREQAEFEGAAA